MEKFLDYLKIDEKIIFERFEFQLTRLVPQARMLAFLAFRQKFLLDPLFEYIQEKSRMEILFPSPSEILVLFENSTPRNPEKLYVLNLHEIEIGKTKELFEKDWLLPSLSREYDFNVVWLMDHPQMNTFAQKYFREMKTNSFIRILYEDSLILTSPEEIQRNAVTAMNLKARPEFENRPEDPLQTKLKLANSFLSEGKYLEAEEQYKMLIDLAEKQARQDMLGKAKGNLGITYKMLFRYKEALELLETQFEIDRKMGNVHNMLSSYANQSSIYSDEGDFVSALRLLDLKEELELKHDLIEQHCETLNNRGNIFLKQNLTSHALECFQKQEEIGLKHGFQKNLAVCYYNMGFLYESLEKWDALLKTLQKEEKLLAGMKEKEALIQNQSRQAIIHLNFGNYAEAFRLFEIEADAHIKNQNWKAYSDCLGNLAIVLHENKNYRESLILLDQEEKIKTDEEPTGMLINCFAKKALAYCMLGEIEKADDQIARKESEENPKDFSAVADTLNVKARIALKKGEIEQCLALSQKESEIRKNIQDNCGIADCHSIMVQAYLESEKPEKAEALLKVRLPIEEKNHRVPGMIETYRQLAIAAKSLKKFEDVLAYNRYAGKLENYHRKENETLNEERIQEFLKKHSAIWKTINTCDESV